MILYNFIYIIQAYINDLLYRMKLKDRPEWRQRRAICSSCTTNIRGVCSKKVCEIINNRRTCGCGCLIEKRIKSDKKCPKGKW